MWEFVACVDGWKSLNGVKREAQAHSEDEAIRLGLEGFD